MRLYGKNLVELSELQLDSTTPVTIDHNWTVLIGGLRLSGEAVNVTNTMTLDVIVPGSMLAGDYAISIESARGAVAFLQQPLLVVDTQLADNALSTTDSKTDSTTSGTPSSGPVGAKPAQLDAGTVGAGSDPNAAPVASIVDPPLVCTSECNSCQAGDCCREACDSSGCPTCTTGCACDLSCQAGDLCETVCDPGTSCWLDSVNTAGSTLDCQGAACASSCNSGRNCTMACTDGSNCELRAKYSEGSTVQCVGSNCKQMCTAATSCALTCEAGSTCEMNCIYSGQCTLGCDSDSSCLLNCQRTGTCDMLCDNPINCSDGVIACNRECP